MTTVHDYKYNSMIICHAHGLLISVLKVCVYAHHAYVLQTRFLMERTTVQRRDSPTPAVAVVVITNDLQVELPGRRVSVWSPSLLRLPHRAPVYQAQPRGCYWGRGVPGGRIRLPHAFGRHPGAVQAGRLYIVVWAAVLFLSVYRELQDFRVLLLCFCLGRSVVWAPTNERHGIILVGTKTTCEYSHECKIELASQKG